MNQLEYVPGIGGASVQMDGPTSFVGIAEEMRSREWDYDLGYRDLVTATRPARTVDVTFHADYDTADTLRRVADADVMARTPGTFVAQNEWKQRGYILASDVDDIHYGRLSTGLKIALLDGAWWRLAKRSFVPEITTPEYRSATGLTVTASGASGAPLHALTVDGKAVQDGTPTPSSPVPVETVSGINLFTKRVAASGNGITLTVDSQGVCTLNGTATNSAWFTLDTVLPAGTYTLSANNPVANNGVRITGEIDGTYPNYVLSDVNTKNTFTASTGIAKTSIVVNSGTVLSNFVIKPQLEVGATATPYIPYGSIGLKVGSTITPINLQGNVLASLPDGTKDVLTVDSAGAVTLEKQVGIKTLNGTESWTYYATWNGNEQYCYYTKFNDAHSGYGIVVPLCDFLTGYLRAVFSGNNKPVDSCAFDNSRNFCVRVPYSSKTDLTTWLASNPQNVYYKLATPQTIDLGTIDMPAVPFEAQISITAAVTPTITAEWQISRDAYLDYPHNYPYDYQATSSTGNITPSVLTPSDVYLAVFGPAVNPYVIVGGNRYQVNVTVPSGGYLVVDGRDKTIQLTLADGTVQNVFSSGVRGGGAGGGSYIFERIPAGTSEVTYDGSFGFDLGWYEEEGEPPWSQS